MNLAERGSAHRYGVRVSVLEFIAQMTKALAWPLGAVAVALVFRGQIKALFDRDKGSLSVGPIGLAWDGFRQEVQSDLRITKDSTEPRHL